MNGPHFQHGCPKIIGTVLRVVLANGDPYDVSLYSIARLETLVSCCGGYPKAVIVQVSGRVLATDHEYASVKALWDSWNTTQPPSAA